MRAAAFAVLVVSLVVVGGVTALVPSPRWASPRDCLAVAVVTVAIGVGCWAAGYLVGVAR